MRNNVGMTIGITRGWNPLGVKLFRALTAGRNG